MFEDYSQNQVKMLSGDGLNLRKLVHFCIEFR